MRRIYFITNYIKLIISAVSACVKTFVELIYFAIFLRCFFILIRCIIFCRYSLHGITCFIIFNNINLIHSVIIHLNLGLVFLFVRPVKNAVTEK